jgi:hypothetical protein
MCFYGGHCRLWRSTLIQNGVHMIIKLYTLSAHLLEHLLRIVCPGRRICCGFLHRYGSFAEIGAGQEVARWFFRVGGAAGTIAKSVSA